MDNVKGNCIICGEEIDVEYCCYDRDCGCLGMPVDPPVCSTKCWDAFIEKRDTVGLITSSVIELPD